MPAVRRERRVDAAGMAFLGSSLLNCLMAFTGIHNSISVHPTHQIKTSINAPSWRIQPMSEKTMHEVKVRCNEKENCIYISQSTNDLNNPDSVIMLSPHQVDLVIEWLKEKKAELLNSAAR